MTLSKLSKILHIIWLKWIRKADRIVYESFTAQTLKTTLIFGNWVIYVKQFCRNPTIHSNKSSIMQTVEVIYITQVTSRWHSHKNEYPYQITILHFESKYFKTISSLANFTISWNIFNETVITRTYCWFVFDFPLSYILINGWAAHILSTWISFLVAWRYSSISSSLSFSWVKSIILTAYSLWVDFSMHLLTVLLTPLQHQTKGAI